ELGRALPAGSPCLDPPRPLRCLRHARKNASSPRAQLHGSVKRIPCRCDHRAFFGTCPSSAELLFEARTRLSTSMSPSGSSFEEKDLFLHLGRKEEEVRRPACVGLASASTRRSRAHARPLREPERLRVQCHEPCRTGPERLHAP